MLLVGGRGGASRLARASSPQAWVQARVAKKRTVNTRPSAFLPPAPGTRGSKAPAPGGSPRPVAWCVAEGAPDVAADQSCASQRHTGYRRRSIVVQGRRASDVAADQSWRVATAYRMSPRCARSRGFGLAQYGARQHNVHRHATAQYRGPRPATVSTAAVSGGPRGAGALEPRARRGCGQKQGGRGLTPLF